MSRCFPYPPPGYTIESTICVGKERERKKKRKREKAKKIKIGQSKDDVITQQEEAGRSGITEEHGDPSIYLSDCSSGKRKRQGLCSPPPEKRLKPDHILTSRDNLVEFRTTSVGRAGDDQTPTCSISRRYKELRKEAQHYRDLIENWNPPAFSMLMGTDCDDDGWLSATRKRVVPIPPEKTTSSCSSSSTLWPPRARFLPDANIYALPYVLPF